MVETGIPMTDTLKRDELAKKYKKYIIKNFKNLSKDNLYQDNIFIEEIINYIKEQEKGISSRIKK